VLFTRTTDLVQRLQVARRELALEAAVAKLDKYHLLILDDFCYARKDQAETGVLFELIAARYERRSLLVTANKPFGEWNDVFPDPAMTVAAVDRLVHHATILELNVEVTAHVVDAKVVGDRVGRALSTRSRTASKAVWPVRAAVLVRER
jgi:DNA replication protein DnaC